VHGLVIAHGRGREVDAKGKGRKGTDEARPESTGRKFVDLYSSVVWTMRRGAEIEIENRCYSMQKSDSINAGSGKGLRGGVEREGHAGAGARAILEEHKEEPKDEPAPGVCRCRSQTPCTEPML